MSASKKRITIADRPPITFGEFIPDVVSPEDDLLARIENLHTALGAFLEERVNVEKNTRDGQAVPIDVLRYQLLQGDPCWCRAVRRLLLNESQ